MEPLSTECPPLDALLDGGLEKDAITLVFGEGGSGKTNLALQCARSAAAKGKRVAFVDTEGVSARRLLQVFEGAPEVAQERLLFFTPYSIQEQEKLVRNATVAPDLGLLVVDSINMHYRLHIDDDASEKEASRSLYKQLHHLTNFARQKHVPVLITGQVYGGEDATQPFARRTMEHLVKALVRFEKRPDGTRRATILKHRSIEDGRQARFRIAEHGLVGPGEATRRPSPDEQSGEGPDVPVDRAGGEVGDGVHDVLGDPSRVRVVSGPDDAIMDPQRNVPSRPDWLPTPDQRSETRSEEE